MKRCSIDRSGPSAGGTPVSPIEEKIKRPRSAGGEAEPAVAELGEDLVLEVLKRADARTVGRAACVCRLWRRLAVDERLWEVVCTRDWVKVPYGEQQLRALVLALGGFRRLHSHILPFLDPLLPPPHNCCSCSGPPLEAASGSVGQGRGPALSWSPFHRLL